MKVTCEIKRFFKLLRIDLSILIQNMRVYLGNHVGFGMTRIALCRFQIAVVQFQLISGTRMTERVKNNLRQTCTLAQLFKLLVDNTVFARTAVILCHDRSKS